MSVKALTWVFENSPYTLGTRLVHLALADKANEDHEWRLWLTRAAVAKKCLVSVDTVDRATQKMVKDGYLEMVEPGGGRGKPNEYRLIVKGPQSAESREKGPQSTGENGRNDDRETAASTDSHLLLTQELTQEKPKTETDLVVRVFNAWVKSKNGTGANRLDKKRRKLIELALGSYSPEDVVAAVRGWKYSPYHRGENDTRTAYNDLGLLLRDAEHIERFRDFYRNRASALSASANGDGPRDVAPLSGRAGVQMNPNTGRIMDPLGREA